MTFYYSELLGPAKIQGEEIEIITSGWEKCQRSGKHVLALLYHPCFGNGGMILSPDFVPSPAWHFLGRSGGGKESYDRSRNLLPKCYYLALGVKKNFGQPGTW